MRCPYCGGLNSERAAFCVNCGRDLTRPLPNTSGQRQQPQQNPYPPTTPGRSNPGNVQNAPVQQIYQPPSQRQPASTANPRNTTSSPVPQQVQQTVPQRQPPATARPATTVASSRRDPVVAVPPVAPEAPAPFPPRTMAQFEALLPAGAQQYEVVESHVDFGKRKIVRISYPACTNWQQSATLLKAFREQKEAKFEATIIQGVLPSQPDAYSFTNGQLQFNKDIRLGGQIVNRYILETGNGFASDSIRFVLQE